MARARRGRGEGGVGELPGGLWYAELSLGFDGAGKRIRKRVYGGTKQAVLTALREIQDRAAKGGIPAAGSMTVARLLDSWLAAMKPAWSAGTFASHAQHVRNHLSPMIGGVRLAQLHSLHVQTLMENLEGKGVSASMRRHVAVTLRAALAFSVRMKLSLVNVALPVPLPAKSKHNSVGLTPEQVGAILSAAEGDRLFSLYVLAVDSGLRQGELLALQWNDLDLEKGTVRVCKSLEEVGGSLNLKQPKTKSASRTVAMSDTTVRALKDHRKAMLAEGHCNPTAPVFCGSRRGQWLRKSDLFRHSFRPILDRAGVKCRFHDLRHASATLLLASGIDVKTVQSRLGHSSATVTLDIYCHAIDRGQQQAAAMMNGILASGKG
jgi:integrase